MAYMENLGSYYAIVLHDARLRSGLIAEARQSSNKPWAGVRLRFELARAFRALAIRIEPPQPHGSEPGASWSESPSCTWEEITDEWWNRHPGTTLPALQHPPHRTDRDPEGRVLFQLPS